MARKKTKKSELLELYESGHKTLYMVVINLGGFVHEKVYVLNATRDHCGYWDKNGEHGFYIDDVDDPATRKILGLNKSYGCW